MKRLTKLVSLLLCAAAVLSISALAAEAPLISPAPTAEESEPVIPGPVLIWGKASKLEDGSYMITSGDPNAANSEVIVHVAENTPCVDAVSGLPLDMSKIKDGDTLYTWAGPAMTMSLPPQTTAQVVVGNIPADYQVPEYYEITNFIPVATIAIYPAPERTEVPLKTAGGETLTLPVKAQYTPWLTRQIVTVDDVVPGSRILVWKDKDGAVQKVLVFPYEYKGYLSAGKNGGAVTLNGDVLKVQSRVIEKEDLEQLYLPLRAAAEAAGYEVKWVSGKGAVVYENNGNEMFSIQSGSDVAQVGEEEHGLLGGCVVDGGVTYLPAGDLAYLLNLYFCR